jgi:hypothetical protein
MLSESGLIAVAATTLVSRHTGPTTKNGVLRMEAKL